MFGHEPSILDKDKTKQAQKEEKRYQKEKAKGLKKIKDMTKKIEHMTEKVIKHSDLDYDHRETLERMRGSILLANEVDVQTRTDMMNRLDTIAD